MQILVERLLEFLKTVQSRKLTEEELWVMETLMLGLMELMC